VGWVTDNRRSVGYKKSMRIRITAIPQRTLARLTAFAIALTIVPLATAEVFKTVVYEAGDDGYHTYRIPAIVRAANGDLLAFAEGRKNGPGDHGDIDIVLKRSSDGGRTWSPQKLVQDEWENPTAKIWIGNPSPVADLADKQHPTRIWLAFTQSNVRIYVTSSDDHGETWSERRNITPTAGKKEWDWYAAGPGHGIQLERGPHAGRLLIPCDHQVKAEASWGAHFVYSDNHGRTWKLGAAATHAADDPLHPNESVAVELVDGRVLLNSRDQHGSEPATRAIAYSSDGGETFDAPFVAEPNITTPVVQNSLVRFAVIDRGDDRNILVYACPGDSRARRDLTILVSFDEGKTWTQGTVLHSGPAAYSDLVKLDEKRVGVLYEAGKPLYREIVFATFAVDDLDTTK
jgi:sialidase-1